MRSVEKIIDCEICNETNSIDFVVMDNYNGVWFISCDKETGEWSDWKKIRFPKFPEYKKKYDFKRSFNRDFKEQKNN